MPHLRRAAGDWLADDVLVVPVPLHRWRLWRRGYNQAAELAKALSAATGTPLVSGSAIRFDGQVVSFSLTDGKGPCYACLYDESGEALEDCAGNGVLAPMVATIGIMVAVEAVRRLAGIGPDASGRLLRFDSHAFRWSESRFQRDPACTVCR